MTRFTVLVGAPQPRSATYDAAVLAAGALAEAAGIRPADRVIDLAEFGAGLLAPEPEPGLAEALRAVSASDFVLIATPAAQGTYTGLLKVFVDRLPELGLGGALALPLAVTADPRHAFGIESDLRALLAELGAYVPADGLVLGAAELADAAAPVLAWARAVAPDVKPLMLSAA
ncbi:NADPH-dependent FMN reductase [Allonocardiopsis opalescens]|uniref:FMN reductase n=1 Tax=Allonocardiopsis opalescens TaxID=1144618 RepID=A0A2T0QCD7_9ACTN|nr:NAD(P)H-dependent oxidoreductase [Allonocardiopsis opalescens]PRY01572.1 FMN reductase [Allonocardiopsis opalescens]